MTVGKRARTAKTASKAKTRGSAKPAPTAPEPCATCKKPVAVCVCDRIQPLPSRIRVLILQHPREDDVALGTAKLVALSLPSARIEVGLSWRSLEAALGQEGIDRGRWGVVFAHKLPEPLPADVADRTAIVLDRHGQIVRSPSLDGIVVLDGTWSQAKALWWRNAWLTKLARIVLRPTEPTIYGRTRKAPRREWVSTLEAAADALVALGEPERTRDALRALMRTMVQRGRDAGIR